MATASISGLSSGLDTASIISQLMQLEAVPQSKLKTRVSSEESIVKSLQSMNSQTSALATKAAEVGAASAWTQLSATSSHEGVAVKATTNAGVASFAVTVRALAVGHSETYLNTVGLDEPLFDAADPAKRMLTITRDDMSTTEIDTGDGTLRSVVAAINRTENPTGLRATMLQVSPGQYRLIVESTTTGTESGFSLSAEGGGDILGGVEASRTRSGSNALIEVSGFTLSSSTNTFDEIMPGVSVTLGAKATVDSVSTIDVTRDPATQLASVKSLVESVNALISEAASKTAYNAGSNTSGALSGENAVRALRNALAGTVDPTDNTSMASFGLQIDRSGKLVFDEKVFGEAYAADPDKVAAAFGSENGFAARVKAVADAASHRESGTLTNAISSRQDGIKRLNASVDEWDIRLEMRRSTLERQYTALEVALSNLNSQSSWLASQINSLNAS